MVPKKYIEIKKKERSANCCRFEVLTCAEESQLSWLTQCFLDFVKIHQQVCHVSLRTYALSVLERYDVVGEINSAC